MNQEKETFSELLRRKRAAVAIILGIATLSAATLYAVESNSQSPTVEHIQPGEPEAVTLLKHYERETGVAGGMMEFITMPSSDDEAREQATAFATTLKAWGTADAYPIVVMEPTLDSGDKLDLNKIAAGDDTSVFETYFATLKESGITDAQMGTWVPLPEPNLPEWKDGVTDPEIFSKNITVIASALKKSFPTTPVSILLDSTTYLPSPDPDWSNGERSTDKLLQYLNVQPGLIDSFGLQGFTWSNSDSPNDYLNGEVVAAAAKRLGVKNVWFNTGTYKQTFNPDTTQEPLTADIARRQAVLTSVLRQANTAQNAGLHVDRINIFGQNTFDGSDGTADFSYTSDEELALLRSFTNQAKAKTIRVTIFDAPRG